MRSPPPTHPAAGSPRAVAPGILDAERLARLAEQLGAGGFARLMGRFGPASKSELQRLDAALADGTPEAIRSAAHRIAGFASNFGARGLAHLAKELEHHPEEAGAIAPELRRFVASTEAALDEEAERRRTSERSA